MDASNICRYEGRRPPAGRPIPWMSKGTEFRLEEHPAPLIALRSRHGMTCGYFGERDGIYPHNEYSVVAEDPADINGDLIGLSLTTAGRFGNAMIGCPYAIAIALQKGLRYIRLPDVEGLRVSEQIDIDGLTILPTTGRLPRGGSFLQGPFDNFVDFPLQSKPNVATYYGYIQKYLRPLLKLPPKPPATELVLHIRSGDIFSTYIHKHYVQPPLSFYKAVVMDLVERRQIDRVRVVFEDRLNPCIDPLEEWLATTSLSIVMQSQDFYNDLISMIDCNHFCFGLGTLGPAVCLMSEQIQSVHHFQARVQESGMSFISVKEVSEYMITSNYIVIGEWDNSLEQRQQMIDYPGDKLRLTRL